MKIPGGLYIDDAAWPLLQELVSYWGVTSGAGAADGTTLVCADLANQPSYQNHLIKVLSGDAAGQTRKIVNDTTNATGTVAVDSPFTDSSGAAVTITASTLFVIISDFKDEALYYGTTTSAGAADGSTLVDTGLATPFTVDDECIGHSIRILTSSDATLVGQEREVYDYDSGTTTLVVNPRFTSQVPISTTYVVLRNRPSAGGGPIPPPEPSVEETVWRLADYDNFDVADPTADTERWSSEYQQGVADGSADINTTTAGALRVNITAAAVAAAQYGVRRLWRNVVRKFFTLADVTVTVTNPNANHVWAGLAISRGIAWDANNYIAIYKRQNNVPVEGIAVEYNLAGAGAVTTAILATTQDAIAFKIERENTMWRCYYSLSQAPHHYWILALEIEDPADSLTDTTSTYLTVYNPEDAAGQRIAADFYRWEYYEGLGNLGDIINFLTTSGGALAYMGVCPPGMAASTTTVVCPNLAAFPNNLFNSGYQMIVLRNANVAGAPPEMEMRDITGFATGTGTFTTEAFSANVEENDIVLVIHNSVASKVVVTGVADGGDADTLIDAARTEPNNGYWTGMTLLMLSGSNQYISRPIVDFIAATDSIEVRPAFPAAIVNGDRYVILSEYHEIVPTADSAEDYQPRDVIGAKADTIPAMNLAPGATDSLVRHIKAILERLGATPADPDDSVLTNLGQRDDAATADDLSDVTTTSIEAKLRRILLRMAPNAFGATVNGNVDTALDDMIAHLAAYFVAAGAVWSVTVNPGGGAKTDLVTTLSSIADMLAGAIGIATYPAAANIGDGVSMAEAIRAILTSLVAGDDYDAYTAINNVARASVNACFQGIASVLGADGANVFNPTIYGGARTDLDTGLYNFALYFNALGAALAVVSQPGVAAKTNLNDILGDLADILAGVNGITNFPAAAAPANGVSLAEAIRQIYNDLVTATAAVAAVEAKLDLPAADAVLNTRIGEVVGNKEDTASDDPDVNTLSLMRLLKSLMRTWKCVIPNIDVSLAAIDNVLTTDPSAGAPDAENTIMDLPITAGTMYKLEDIIIKVSGYGTGTQITIRVWELLGGNARANYVNTHTVVVPTDYPITTYLTLVDMTGKPAIVGDGIAITAETDAGNTGALTCTYTYSTARVS